MPATKVAAVATGDDSDGVVHEDAARAAQGFDVDLAVDRAAAFDDDPADGVAHRAHGAQRRAERGKAHASVPG